MPDYDLWVVMGGRGDLTIDAHTFPVTAGSSFVFEPGDRVQGRQDPAHRLSVFFCHFMLQDATGRPLRSSGLPHTREPVRIPDLAALETCARIVTDGWGPDGVDASRTRAELALRLILAQRAEAAARPARPGPDPRIARVLESLQRRPEQRWTTAAMARWAGLSPAQFRRLFEHQTGLPPNAYRIRCRIERARALLAESHLPLAVIADNLGYRDVYFFSRQFKQWDGMSPAAYRRARQQTH